MPRARWFVAGFLLTAAVVGGLLNERGPFDARSSLAYEQFLADVEAGRVERIAQWRDRLEAFLRGAARAQRSRRIAAHAQLVAARPHGDGGWEIVVVRHGRLCATVTTPPGADPRPAVDALLATAEEALPPTLPASAAHPEETDIVLRWLEQPDVRLIEVGEGWACPVRGAEAYRHRPGDGASPLAAALRRVSDGHAPSAA